MIPPRTALDDARALRAALAIASSNEASFVACMRELTPARHLRRRSTPVAGITTALAALIVEVHLLNAGGDRAAVIQGLKVALAAAGAGPHARVGTWSFSLVLSVADYSDNGWNATYQDIETASASEGEAPNQMQVIDHLAVLFVMTHQNRFGPSSTRRLRAQLANALETSSAETDSRIGATSAPD